MALIDTLMPEQQEVLPDWFKKLRAKGMNAWQIKKAEELNEIVQRNPLELAERGAKWWNLWAAWTLVNGNTVKVSFDKDSNLKGPNGCVISTGNWENFLFPDDVSFLRAEFTDNVSFRKAHFCTTAKFSSVAFRGRASFLEAIFGYRADFDNAKFDRGADFYQTSFLRWAGFENAHFSEWAVFSESHFALLGDFSNAEFEGETNFESSDFGGVAHFTGATFTDWASFKNTRFAEFCFFNAITIKAGMSFVDTSFAKAVPEFQAVNMIQTPDFTGSFIPHPKDILSQIERDREGAQSPSRTYRRLKEFAAQAHDHHLESRLFRFEMLSKRGTEETSSLGSLGITLYEWASRCGQSFWRPVGWWALSIFIFATIYALYYGFDTGYGLMVPGDGWAKAILLSLQNSLPLVGVQSARGSETVDLLLGGSGLGATLLLITQNLISTVLLFLAGLGARNFFKLR